MKHLLSVFTLLFTLILIFPVQAQNVDLPNLQEPRSGVLTCGQPTPEGIKQLASRGIKTVINLRPYDEEGARNEASEAEALGMNYVHIPLTPQTFSLNKVNELRCVLKNEKSFPVLIHCQSGSRVGGLWLLYRVISEKADLSTAVKEAREIGIKPGLEEQILKVLEQIRNEDSDVPC